MSKVLVIDDEYPILESLEMFLSEKGYQVDTAETAARGIEALARFQPEVVILDIHLPDRSGFEVLEHVGLETDPPKVIMITAYHDMDTTITSMKMGAYDYIHKPLDADEVENAVKRAVKALEVERKSAPARNFKGSDDEDVIIGKSRPILEVMKMIGILCQNNATALIQGETGTGKELIARVIHQNSANTGEPFITMDCSAVVETLLESELFGHEKGAFTGATHTKIGKIELAGKGTLFLDEIGELVPSLQGKFLGFLERREFVRVGGQYPQRSQSRVISATNRDLTELVEKGLFRQDLYYRLRVVTLSVPPLRDRIEDIPDLAHHFLGKVNQGMLKNFQRFQEGVIPFLMNQEWTGNVRELKNVIIAAAVRSRGNVILLEDVEKVLAVHQDESRGGASEPALSRVEHQHILKVLKQVKWNRSQAARLLGISLPTLRSKIRKYDIDTEED